MTPGKAANPLDERRDGVWPRVYRPTRKQRLSTNVSSAILLVGGIAALGAGLVWKPEKETVAQTILLTIIGLCALLAVAYTIAWIRHSRVLLFEDAIEIVQLGHVRRRLRRDEIRGIRLMPLQHGAQTFIFELHDPGRKPIKTYLYCERDAVLHAWLATLTDLDKLDQERAQAELLARPDLGTTQEERQRALATARTIARAANVFTAIACAGALLYPWPYTFRTFTAVVMTLAVIPLAAAALLLGGRRLYSVDRAPNDIRPSLALPLIAPGVVLMFLAHASVQVVDWHPLVLWVTLATLAFAAILAIGEPGLRRRPGALLILLLLLLPPHPLGALLIANAVFDRSGSEIFRVAVLEKYTASSKGPNHHVRVASWGPVTGGEINVDRRLYDTVEVGSVVCVVLRPGALGLRWFTVRACDPATAR